MGLRSRPVTCVKNCLEFSEAAILKLRCEDVGGQARFLELSHRRQLHVVAQNEVWSALAELPAKIDTAFDCTQECVDLLFAQSR